MINMALTKKLIGISTLNADATLLRLAWLGLAWLGVAWLGLWQPEREASRESDGCYRASTNSTLSRRTNTRPR